MKLRVFRTFRTESIEEVVSTSRLAHDRVAEARMHGGHPMETFHKLFGSLLGFVYHCFDRIVIQGYLPLLTRPEHIVHFFRDVHGVSPLTKDALAKRTQEYQQWVEAFARNHQIPIEWLDAAALKTKKLKKEDYVRP